MFSQRLPWSCPANRLSRLLDEKRVRGVRLLDLTESNPTRVGLPYPSEEIAAALADPAVGSYDPHPRGSAGARRAVTEYYAERGLAVDEERVVLTSGTSEAYALLFKMLVDPGEAVLVPRPSYPLLDYLAALEGARIATYPVSYDGGWGIDLDAVERRIDAGQEPTRVLVLVSPNNPTGQALTMRERLRLEKVCAGRGVAVIADEVFLDYLFRLQGGGRRTPDPRAPGDDSSVPEGTSERVLSMCAPRPAGDDPPVLSFTLGGLSKSCGMPQMKLAWIVVGGPEGMVREALERLELIADTYLSVGTPVQLAAARLMEIGAGIRASIRARIRENRSALMASVADGSPCRVLEADGGWYAVLHLPAVVPEEELVLNLLADDDLLVHPGYFFDFPREAYLVLSLLPEPGLFREGFRRLLHRVSKAGGRGPPGPLGE